MPIYRSRDRGIAIRKTGAGNGPRAITVRRARAITVRRARAITVRRARAITVRRARAEAQYSVSMVPRTFETSARAPRSCIILTILPLILTLPCMKARCPSSSPLLIADAFS